MGLTIQRLPPFPKVEAVVDPSKGTGTLTWYADPSRPRKSDRIVLTISSAPWHQLGVRPFAFDWVEATNPRGTPLFRVGVTRATTVTQKAGPPGREKDMPAGSSPLAAGLVKRVPFIVLHRCQDDGLLSDPEAAFEWHSIVGQPETVRPQETRNWSLTKFKTVQITPRGSGVSFQQIQGGYDVAVTLSDLGKPAAFCYDVNPDELAFSTVIRIVHTRGVDIRVRAHESYTDYVAVETCEVSSLVSVHER